MVEKWVKELYEDTFKCDLVIDGVKYAKINSPRYGQKVYYANEKGLQLVEIIKGQYWGEYGLSNFWYWYLLNENGERISKEHGYGSFFVKEENK